MRNRSFLLLKVQEFERITFLLVIFIKKIFGQDAILSFSALHDKL